MSLDTSEVTWTGIHPGDVIVDPDLGDGKSDVGSSAGKTRHRGVGKRVLCGFGIVLLLAAVGVAIFLLIHFLGPKPGLATTSLGTLKGRVVRAPQGREIEEFLGIPFAEKPIGALRYADPVPLDKLPQDPYPATDYRFSCMQFLDTTFGDFQGSSMWNAPNPVSEDCLYLNVWTPKNRDRSRKLPVMVWIYGGGFFSGSSALWVYDGKALAAHGEVVVVSFNYRVGTFGYLSTGDGRIKGNFGMKDQVLALRWIRDNIAAFGGDPDSVTIFGESSGASSAGLHMMSNMSSDLFRRAICESGSPDSHWSFMTQEQAKTRSRSFLAAIECEQVDTAQLLSCLRKKSADDILKNEWVTSKFMVFPWAPSVDGEFLNDTPHNLLYQGRIATKDTLLGVNRDEGTYWILYTLPGLYRNQPSLQNYTMFRNGVDTIAWDLSEVTRERIKTIYSPEDVTNMEANRDNLDKVCGDRSFTCPTKELTRILSESGSKTYFYYLTYRASNEVWHPWMGVIHGAEIQWVFGMPMNDSRNYTDDEIGFSRTIMTYWTNFAKTGDPNGRGTPQWPPYTTQKPQYMEMHAAPSDFNILTSLRDTFCDVWTNINNRTFENIPV